MYRQVDKAVVWPVVEFLKQVAKLERMYNKLVHAGRFTTSDPGLSFLLG